MDPQRPLAKLPNAPRLYPLNDICQGHFSIALRCSSLLELLNSGGSEVLDKFTTRLCDLPSDASNPLSSCLGSIRRVEGQTIEYGARWLPLGKNYNLGVAPVRRHFQSATSGAAPQVPRHFQSLHRRIQSLYRRSEARLCDLKTSLTSHGGTGRAPYDLTFKRAPQPEYIPQHSSFNPIYAPAGEPSNLLIAASNLSGFSGARRPMLLPQEAMSGESQSGESQSFVRWI
ncbi:hypothetical protein NMY22_g16354 [Coprinellus aureogranulatus]|nr:hypothetical protein NMY22_g16354 [Coprinellus aureogranulatus]